VVQLVRANHLKQTAKLTNDKAGSAKRDRRDELADGLDETRTEPFVPSADMRLVLKCLDNARVFSVPITTHPVIVGRTEGEVAPTIDLTPINDPDHGVSRHHAAFTLRDNELHLEDLRSTNGTRINGFQIDSGRAYRLRNGDEIELGRLRLTVSVIRIPPRLAR